MKYTHYYSNLLKAKGIPHLTVAQQQQLMNIVYIEGGIAHLDQLKCAADTQANKSKLIYNLTAKLYNITKSQDPELFFREVLDIQN